MPGNVVHSLFPLTSLLGDMLQLCLLLLRILRPPGSVCLHHVYHNAQASRVCRIVPNVRHV
eukprot:SAG31_NODE_474_length_15176_cov_7.362340_6_plen_61_part_00